MNTMNAYLGIAPEKIIARNISKKGISQRELAALSGIHFQTINAIVQGRRKMTPRQSVLLDEILGFEKGFLAVIQAYYAALSISLGQKTDKPIPIIRPVVFWDVDISKLSWTDQKDFIIARVEERGNEEEIKQVREYYGQ